MSRQSNNNKITAIYTRIDYPGNPTEIQFQQKMLTQYAEANQLENIVYYSDDGFTGRSSKRPSFQHMVTDMKAGKIDIVVVRSLDRLSRNAQDVRLLLEVLFPQFGVSLYSCRENIAPEQAAHPHTQWLNALLGGER